MDDMKQLELFEPYESDPHKSYQKFMWTKNGHQTIYWPTQREWREMEENRENFSSKKGLTDPKSVL